MLLGIKRAKKFKIGADGNPAYEALINSPLARVMSEDKFTNYGDFYVVVHYMDMGYVDERSEDEKGEDDGGDESSNRKRR